jgi:hypothetical protein
MVEDDADANDGLPGDKIGFTKRQAKSALDELNELVNPPAQERGLAAPGRPRGIS